MKFFKKLDIKIGDYVILDDGKEIIHEIYGKVVNIGKTHKDTFLVLFFDLTPEQRKFIDNHNEWNGDDDIVPLYKLKFINPDENEAYYWVHMDYLIKYETKEEFDKAVENIKMKKTAKKYNL